MEETLNNLYSKIDAKKNATQSDDILAYRSHDNEEYKP